MSGHQSGSDKTSETGPGFWVLLPKGRANHSSQCSPPGVTNGLDPDHVDGGGHRYRDGPGLLNQVTVAGDVVSRRAPHLIIIRSENLSPRLDLIMAEVGAIAPKERSTL